MRPIVALLILALGCEKTKSHGSSSIPMATPEARHALGVADPFPGEALSEEDFQEMLGSLSARRAMAWKLTAQAIAPVTVGTESVPRFITWYARDDVDRIFRKLYGEMAPDERKERQRFSEEALQEVEQYGPNAVLDSPNWSRERLHSWLGALNTPERWHGLAGISRTLYGPETLRHILRNYEGVATCSERESCFAEEASPQGVVVKTSWHRAEFGRMLPVFDTSAEGLSARFENPTGSWGAGDGQADPGPGEVFTMTSTQGDRYRLAGLHIASKVAREWVWITLWWSPDAHKDFGQDRPEWFASQLGTEWSHYKMCVVIAHDEGGILSAEEAAKMPELAASLEATQNALGPQSWCSNPYLEQGAHNHRTNCIGCHQHAGTDVVPEHTLTDESAFPGEGRVKVRDHFPADYLWSLDHEPENLGRLIRQRMQHYERVDANVTRTPP